MKKGKNMKVFISQPMLDKSDDEMKKGKKMKVFISQPMLGKSDDEIKKERDNAITKIKNAYGDDVEIIDSFFEGAPHDAKPLWFLGKSLQKLSEADAAYFCDGWERARGCGIEHKCALEYGISVIHS